MGPPLLFLGLEDQKHFFGPIPAVWIPSKQLKVSSEAGLKTRYLHWVPRMPGGPGGAEEGTGDGPGRPGGPRGTRSPREGQGRGQEGQEAKERLLMWPMREQREEAAAVTF